MPPTILAFDPDPECCFALQEVLRVYNYRIKVSASGKDVHEAIIVYKPDLLIFNLQLYQLDEHFRNDLDKSLAALYLPIIILKDDSSTAIKQWVEMTFYQAKLLNKPFEAATLKSTITNLIRLRLT